VASGLLELKHIEPLFQVGEFRFPEGEIPQRIIKRQSLIIRNKIEKVQLSL